MSENEAAFDHLDDEEEIRERIERLEIMLDAMRQFRETLELLIEAEPITRH